MPDKTWFDGILDDPVFGMYILVGHQPVKAESLQQWGVWFQTHDRRVARTTFGAIIVSTVFLGIDHSYGGTPILFETMIFWNGEHELDNWQDRYRTWEEAEEGHRNAVKLVEEALGVISRTPPNE